MCKLYFFILCVWTVCLCVCLVPNACLVLKEAREGVESSGPAVTVFSLHVWVLGTKPRSSVRTDALHLWASHLFSLDICMPSFSFHCCDITAQPRQLTKGRVSFQPTVQRVESVSILTEVWQPAPGMAAGTEESLHLQWPTGNGQFGMVQVF